MRVLYIHHRPELGGAPTSLALLLAEIARRPDVVIRVLCPPGPVLEYFRRQNFDTQAIPISAIYHIPGNSYKGFRWLLCLKELGFLIPHLLSLRRNLISFRPDIVHLNEVVLVPAAALARSHGAKIVWHVRGVLDHGHWGLRRRLILHCLRHWADQVITIDDDERADLDGLHNVLTVHNSVPGRILSLQTSKEEARKKLGLQGNGVVVAMVSRLQGIKGSYDFVEAARLLGDSRPDLEFVMAGGAARPSAYFRTRQGRLVQALGLAEDAESKVRALVIRYELTDRLKLLPFIGNVEDVYAAADVVVFPSYLRGPSRSMLEAAAMGVPTVATTVNWNNDVVIDGKTGFLVPQGDVPALSEAIGNLLRAPELRREMGRAARIHAQEAFDPVRNAEAIYAIYRGLLGEEELSHATRGPV
jgi:glycosyltransferase involved in cell wall biosynthesis